MIEKSSVYRYISSILSTRWYISVTLVQHICSHQKPGDSVIRSKHSGVWHHPDPSKDPASRAKFHFSANGSVHSDECKKTLSFFLLGIVFALQRSKVHQRHPILQQLSLLSIHQVNKLSVHLSSVVFNVTNAAETSWRMERLINGIAIRS